MPCHTAYHPSDTYEYRVRDTRREVPMMLWMIKRICGIIGIHSYLQESPLYDELNNLMAETFRLPLVHIVGLGNTVDDPRAKEKIERLAYAAHWYGALNSLVTAELCRICLLAENTAGKILQPRELTWWNQHRNSMGHDSTPPVEKETG